MVKLFQKIIYLIIIDEFIKGVNICEKNSLKTNSWFKLKT